MSSAFEHIVPEQMFSTVDEPVEAVSTVKALTLAAQEGQKIYTITQENQEQIDNVVIDTEARTEINNALAIGLQVTVHERPLDRLDQRPLEKSRKPAVRTQKSYLWMGTS